MPEHGFGKKGKQCYGEKKSKKRVTLAFFVTASSKKEKPVFIWKLETPWCLQKFDKSVVPVDYYSQKRAWMTGDIIMDAVLSISWVGLNQEKRGVFDVHWSNLCRGTVSLLSRAGSAIPESFALPDSFLISATSRGCHKLQSQTCSTS